MSILFLTLVVLGMISPQTEAILNDNNSMFSLTNRWTNESTTINPESTKASSYPKAGKLYFNW